MKKTNERNEARHHKEPAETERAEWIIKLAKDQAQADQDTEWENKMGRMLQTVREKEMNRKLTAILQG